jgi:hypothetical protein
MMTDEETKSLEEYEKFMLEEKADIDLKKIIFFSRIRSSVYNDLLKNKEEDWYDQWQHLVGNASRSKDGRRIRISKKTESVLWRLVEYYEMEEGLEYLKEIGVEVPDHPDTITSWISQGISSKELNNLIFKYVLKKYRKML